MTRAITIRLDLSDYDRLEGEAKSLGMRPGTLAKVLLHGSLSDKVTLGVDSVGARLAALDRLVAMSAGRPPISAVALLHESRQDIGETAT